MSYDDDDDISPTAINYDAEPIYHEAEVLCPERRINNDLIEVKPTASEEDLVKSDLEISNFQLKKLLRIWDSPNLCVDSVCKLALTTTKLIEHRRKILTKPQEVKTIEKEKELPMYEKGFEAF